MNLQTFRKENFTKDIKIDKNTVLNEAKNVFDIEIENLMIVRNELGEEFIELVNKVLECDGRVIITGMGKSGHIGNKIAATMASLGIPSFFVHPAEAAHGDLGMIISEDIVIAISNSGETDEITQLIPSIKKIGAYLVSLTSKRESTLSTYADLSIKLNVIREAEHNNLAPTTSTTITLAFGDALAVVISNLIGFKPENFALFHPKGALGKRLLTKVADLMCKEEDNPTIKNNSTLIEAILVMSSKGLGAANVIDEQGKLVGILTDGDLRRIIEKYDNVRNLVVSNVMTKKPIYIKESELAVEALNLMERREKPIMILPVVNESFQCTGMIRLHDIVKAGI